MHSFLKVPPQHFSQVEVWTLTGALQHLDSFLCHTFCCRSAGFSPALAVGQMASHLNLEYFGIQRSSWWTQRSCGCRTSPNHQPSTTVLDSWYEVFVLICCVWFPPNVLLCIRTKHLHFGLVCPKDIVPEVLCFVQMQLCKP